MSQQPPPPPIDPLIRQRVPSGNVPPPPPRRPNPPTSAAAQARPHVAAAPVGATRRTNASAASRRTPPARKSKIASLALSIAATVGLTAAFARGGGELAATGLDSTGDTGSAPGSNTGVAGGTGTATQTVGGVTVTTTPQTSADSNQSVAAIADGTYTGDTFTNRWGPVQVQVVYTSGSITDVVVLRYPDGDRKSVSINQRALPRYQASVLAAQSADISRISGATYTWRSFRQSVQSAIDAAVTASGTAG